jgi:peptide/nickel transport system substrate-binding protein
MSFAAGRSGRLLRRVGVGEDPEAVAAGARAVWVANRGDGTVSKIDPGTLAVTGTIGVGDAPSALATGADRVWVANAGDGTLARVDPTSDRVVRTIRVGNPPEGVAAVGRRAYTAVRSNGREHRGGTVRVVSDFWPVSVDPGLADFFAWPTLASTNDGLLAFRHTGGVQGTQVVPDLATALPAVSDGGKTYTFELRRGIEYSTRRLVQPEDFRWAIERVLLANGWAAPYYRSIVGANHCVARSSCDLAKGIVVDRAAHTITFHLTAPDSELLFKLALPTAFAVPPDTPPRDRGDTSSACNRSVPDCGVSALTASAASRSQPRLPRMVPGCPAGRLSRRDHGSLASRRIGNRARGRGRLRRRRPFARP